jgi:hypothetical protein
MQSVLLEQVVSLVLASVLMAPKPVMGVVGISAVIGSTVEHVAML